MKPFGELENAGSHLVANADVRENILSLRTTLANGKAGSAIGEYLDEFYPNQDRNLLCEQFAWRA